MIIIRLLNCILRLVLRRSCYCLARSVYNLRYFDRTALLVENGKFLLAAKRTRRTTSTEYVISMDADNISRSSSTYIGKLR